jgi:3-oxoacyl-[acyl-carrier protein] reductase
MQLKNKIAIVTGGGRGIGRAIALALAKEGCNIVLAARTKKELKQTATELRSYNVEALPVVADIRFSKNVKNLVKQAIRKFEKIDILINNAGILIAKPIHKTTEREWDATLDTNLKGSYLCIKEVLPYMIEQGEGVIINISSGAGRHGFANLAAYCASKFGQIGLTESVAAEVERHNIRVYAVLPGAVATRMQEQYVGPAFKLTKHLMLKPEDVAKKVVELCLPDCDIPTGSSIEIYF